MQRCSPGFDLIADGFLIIQFTYTYIYIMRKVCFGLQTMPFAYWAGKAVYETAQQQHINNGININYTYVKFSYRLH